MDSDPLILKAQSLHYCILLHITYISLHTRWFQQIPVQEHQYPCNQLLRWADMMCVFHVCLVVGYLINYCNTTNYFMLPHLTSAWQILDQKQTQIGHASWSWNTLCTLGIWWGPGVWFRARHPGRTQGIHLGHVCSSSCKKNPVNNSQQYLRANIQFWKQ